MTDDNDHSSREGDRPSRRRILAAGVTALSLPIAGCSAIGDGESTPTATATPTPEPDPASIAYGDTVEGYVSDDDETDPPEGVLAEPITFRGNRGDEVSGTVLSTAFDGHLSITDPEGAIVGESGEDGSLEAALSADAQYTLWAGSQAGNATGPYTLSLRRTGEALVSIAYGETAEGELTEDDETVPETDSLGHPVGFEGESGDLVSVRLESEAFDPLLVLTGPDGDVIAENDDGGEGLNSLLETALSEDGEYTVWVTSFGGDDTGSYTLSVEKTGEIEPAPEDLREIEYGASARGTLDDADPTIPETDLVGEPVTFSGSARDRITATLESRAFEGVLALLGADDRILASAVPDTDEVARMDAVLPDDGEYALWVTSVGGGGRGPYTLSVEKTGEAEPAREDLRSIEYGASARGTIDEDDPEVTSRGGLGEPVAFSGAEGDRVVAAMESQAVDAYLLLAGPDGEVLARNDDGGDGYNSRLEAVLPADGEYTLWATTFATDTTGIYSLSLAKEGEAEPAQQDLRSIEPGETARGTIDEDDEIVPERGDAGEPVTFDGSDGDTVTVTMESQRLDPYLLLTDPDDEVVARDDDGGRGLNSELRTTLESDGEYTIWATSFGGEFGRYTLELTVD